MGSISLYKESDPCPALEVFVEKYYKMQYLHSDKPRKQSLLPDGFSHLLLIRNGSISAMEAAGEIRKTSPILAVSQLKRRMNLRFYGDTLVYGIILKPLGLRSLFGLDVRACFDCLPDNPAVYTNLYPLFDPVLSTQDDPGLDGFAKFCDTLLSGLLAAKKAAPVWLPGLLAEIDQGAWKNPAYFLNGHAGVGPRRLQIVINEWLGCSLKIYLRIMRFNQFLKLCRFNTTLCDLKTAAAACGYYDQSHLCHEIRAITGYTPTHYLLRNLTILGIGASASRDSLPPGTPLPQG